ncbi:MAG TPA: 3-hydroxy-3-methylglutaryl-CoA reductase, partial [Thermofilum sp.]|nr:3-hydroxy-3-methylglutaryl-CoA reductase [Thermofilum sp.]
MSLVLRLPGEKTSRIPGFYKLPIKERLEKVADFAGLTDEEKALLLKEGNLDFKTADIMIENVIGTMAYPFAVAVNFLINGKDYMVPMVIEESSVVAAASNAAKVMRRDGGIKSVATDPVMIGQIQVIKLRNPWYVKMQIIEH